MFPTSCHYIIRYIQTSISEGCPEFLSLYFTILKISKCINFNYAIKLLKFLIISGYNSNQASTLLLEFTRIDREILENEAIVEHYLRFLCDHTCNSDEKIREVSIILIDLSFGHYVPKVHLLENIVRRCRDRSYSVQKLCLELVYKWSILFNERYCVAGIFNNTKAAEIRIIFNGIANLLYTDSRNQR